MAKIILIKRGLAAQIDSAELREGELAIGYSDNNKTAAALFVGTGNGNYITLNPDFTSSIATALSTAEGYTDQKIADLVNGAPQTLDTLKEIADALADNDEVIEAINSAIANKLAKPATDGTAGQVLKWGVDGPYWDDETDTTYTNATTEHAGLMSAADKTKLDGVDGELDGKVDKETGKGLSTNDYTTAEKEKLAGISSTTGDTQTVTQADKDKWNAEVIDGGTY